MDRYYYLVRKVDVWQTTGHVLGVVQEEGGLSSGPFSLYTGACLLLFLAFLPWL